MTTQLDSLKESFAKANWRLEAKDSARILALQDILKKLGQPIDWDE